MTANDASTLLKSWNDTAATQAIVEFVDRATREGDAGYISPSDRIAVFDNDGTLWCEKPMPIELGFILRRLAEMCESDSTLRDKHPWKAAHEKDYAWLGNAMTKHYHGDDNDLKVLMGGILRAFAGVTVDDYAAAADEFLSGRHPTLDRSLRECAYLPMIDLLRYLEANGFSTYIASGGDRDFMRPVTEEIYGIPGRARDRQLQRAQLPRRTSTAERSSTWTNRTCSTTARQSRSGSGAASAGVRVVAGGNSNGDIPMLRYAGGRARPALRLLVLHDDPEREFDYTAGAETSLERAAAEDWTVVSIKRDWATVFA